jgi:hypothetical protein
VTTRSDGRREQLLRPTSRARRNAVELLGGLALGAFAIAAGPGIGPEGAFALLVLAVAAGAHLVAALRRRRARRSPLVAPRARGGRRSRRTIAIPIVEIAAAVVVAGAASSWVSAMLQPSNSSLAIRTVEWMRDNGGAGLVSDVERWYYSLTAPAKGGPALRQLPVAGITTAAAPAPPAPPSRVRQRAHRRPAYRPRDVRPVIHPALPGEGVWNATQSRFAGDRAPPLLVTTYRPDPSYPRVVAGLAWINAGRTTVSLYPGLSEPPTGGTRSAEVPTGLRTGLIATFNGGFKHKDGQGGFYTHDSLLEPLVAGQGTVIGTRNGQLDVRTWQGGSRPGPGVSFARQNLPLIVSRGRPNPNLSDGPEWGATLGNRILVWRSAVGVDRRGNLIYAAAPEQTVAGMARILIHAGAVRGVELDINSYWVSLNTYAATGARRASRLLPGMNRPAQRYLTPDDRDFFAVYLR